MDCIASHYIGFQKYRIISTVVSGSITNRLDVSCSYRKESAGIKYFNKKSMNLMLFLFLRSVRSIVGNFSLWKENMTVIFFTV
jgi:hypothetical protein